MISPWPVTKINLYLHCVVGVCVCVCVCVCM